MKVSVYIATSLDGFIAREDGDIDWLNAANVEGDSAEYGYSALMESVDYVIMGRNSFEKVLSFGGWHYSKPVIVLSRSLTIIPEQAAGKAELYAGDIADLLDRCRNEGCKRLYIDGGKVIQSFLRAGHITDLTITTIPILLGSGLPLFGTLPKDINLKLISSTGYAVSGFVQSLYEVAAHSNKSTNS